MPSYRFTHRHSGRTDGETAQETRGRLLDRGWRYDLEVWFFDTFVLRGKVRDLRRRVVDLAELRSGQAMLDVGCGTGTVAIDAARRVGGEGRVVGIDPAPRRIARARSKARRAGLPIDFRVAAIESLPFPDGSFDVVTSTLMMHHLPEDVKRQGLSEIVRVLKARGRLVVADFEPSEQHARRAARLGTGQTGIQHQPELMRRAGFAGVEAEEVQFPTGAHRRWAGVALLLGKKP